MRAGDNKRAHLILDDLFNVVEPTPDQTRLIAKAAIRGRRLLPIRTTICRTFI